MLYVLSYVAGDKLITHNDQEIVKVGFTDNWDTRQNSYRYALPLPVKVFAKVDGSRDDEQRFHSFLSPHKASGEWYYKTKQFKNDLSFLFDRRDLLWGVDADSPLFIDHPLTTTFISWLSLVKNGKNLFLSETSLSQDQIGFIVSNLETPESEVSLFLSKHDIGYRLSRDNDLSFYSKEN